VPVAHGRFAVPLGRGHCPADVDGGGCGLGHALPALGWVSASSAGDEPSDEVVRPDDRSATRPVVVGLCWSSGSVLEQDLQQGSVSRSGAAVAGGEVLVDGGTG